MPGKLQTLLQRCETESNYFKVKLILTIDSGTLIIPERGKIGDKNLMLQY